MKAHWKYLKYVLRHKWFVFVASWKIGGSMFRAAIHDLSKFMPSEWRPYAYWFYGWYGYAFNGGFLWEHKENAKAHSQFDVAWLLHQHRNRHHWQYWVLQNDTDGTYPLPMPTVYVYEMVADWMGAGRAITGKWECGAWYAKNKEKMVLHNETRLLVEQLLAQHCRYNPYQFDEADHPDPEKET